jgi:hypothetical protein
MQYDACSMPNTHRSSQLFVLQCVHQVGNGATSLCEDVQMDIYGWLTLVQPFHNRLFRCITTTIIALTPSFTTYTMNLSNGAKYSNPDIATAQHSRWRISN